MKFKNAHFLVKRHPKTEFGFKKDDYYCELNADTGGNGSLRALTDDYKTRKGAVNAINKLAEQLGIKERIVLMEGKV